MPKVAHNVVQEVLLEEPIKTVKAAKASVLSLNSLLGKWNNCDRQTRGLVTIMLSAQGSTLKVQAFGNCTPTPCDWGIIQGIAYADNVSASNAVAFSAQYDFGFKASIVTGHFECGSLVVETYDMFKDGSGRSNYFSRAYFYKA